MSTSLFVISACNTLKKPFIFIDNSLYIHFSTE